MKNCVKKAICFILILASTLISGCGEENISESSLVSKGDSLSSDFSVSEDALTSIEVSTSSALVQSNNSSRKPSSSSSVQGGKDVTTEPTTTVGQSPSVEEPSFENDTVAPINSGFKAIWISYFEFPFKGANKEKAKEKMSDMMEKIANQGYTVVFGHVRANADAFYPSKIFPFAKQLTGVAGKDPGYDPLEIMIWAAKKYGLEFHAWINPYRVSGASANPEELAENQPAKNWLSDLSGRAVVHDGGIYFNPASVDVQKLILDGVREILDNYNVDGIHFDDYFYPQKITEDFDSNQYNQYLQSASTPLSLDDWRRANVNTLVSSVYRLCKSKGKIFGISPAGNMSKDNSHDNYKYLYADVALWMKEEGYVDYILPQLYFGYNHPTEKARYAYLLDIWAKLPKHTNLKFYVGLGAYKMNETCLDEAEWHNETDLLARQATDALKIGADGIAVFSYTASMLNNEHNALQIKNMFEAIDKLSQ